jgi:hypothetical protein
VDAGAIFGSAAAYLAYRLIGNVFFIKRLTKSEEGIAIPGNEMKNL